MLLTADAPFLPTNVCDWGPVSLLLLATLTCVNLLVRHAQTGSIYRWSAAFLVAGLAIWYKAVFIFPFAAIIARLVVVSLGELRSHFSLRKLSCAVLGLATSAPRLSAFNFVRPGATASAMAGPDSALGARCLSLWSFRSPP